MQRQVGDQRESPEQSSGDQGFGLQQKCLILSRHSKHSMVRRIKILKEVRNTDVLLQDHRTPPHVSSYISDPATMSAPMTTAAAVSPGTEKKTGPRRPVRPTTTTTTRVETTCSSPVWTETMETPESSGDQSQVSVRTDGSAHGQTHVHLDVPVVRRGAFRAHQLLGSLGTIRYSERDCYLNVRHTMCWDEGAALIITDDSCVVWTLTAPASPSCLLVGSAW